MTLEELIAKQEIQELVNDFSNLADDRDAQGQGPLFTEDAVLEFQMGPDGEVNEIPGRDAIVAAFERTVGVNSTAKAVYHANGQLSPGAVIVYEHASATPDLPLAHAEVVKTKARGTTAVTLFRWED